MRKYQPPFSTSFPVHEQVRKFLIFSLIAHIALLGITLFRLPATKVFLTTRSSSYSVSLVSAPADVASVGVAQKDAITSFDVKSLSAFSGVFAKSKASLETKAAIDEIRRRVEAGQGQETVASTKGQQEQLGDLLMEYYSSVGGKVKNNWKLPRWVSTRGEIETVIALRVLRDGSLAYAAFEKSSGNYHLDESAMRAVQRSAPFQPLPEWIRDSHLDIGIRFNPREIR